MLSRLLQATKQFRIHSFHSTSWGIETHNCQRTAGSCKALTPDFFPEICSTSKLTCLSWVNAVYQDSFACGSLAQKDSIIASSKSGQYTERPLKPGNPSELNLNFPDIPFTNHWHAPHPLLVYNIAETEQLHSKLSYSIEYKVISCPLWTTLTSAVSQAQLHIRTLILRFHV